MAPAQCSGGEGLTARRARPRRVKVKQNPVQPRYQKLVRPPPPPPPPLPPRARTPARLPRPLVQGDEREGTSR